MKEKEAIELLKKHSSSEEDFDIVLRHSETVKRIAIEIAQDIINNDNNSTALDMETVKIGSLLHDIGRFCCPPWKGSTRHGIEGARILREIGLEKYARIAERHLGGGITKEDIIEQGLDLPKKDFLPKTIEEKIITIADKMAEGDKRIPIDKTLERFKKEISIKSAKRIKRLYDEIESLRVIK